MSLVLASCMVLLVFSKAIESSFRFSTGIWTTLGQPLRPEARDDRTIAPLPINYTGINYTDLLNPHLLAAQAHKTP
ncbi:MAG: hypothetical protein MUF72_08845 [Elainella sp. Prado103]|nr:hypothetical protein [Elainella sp. Prado103]